MNRNRSLAALLGVAAGTVLMAAPAYANKPAVDPAADAVTVTACGGIELLQEVAFAGGKFHEQPDGSLRITGVFKIRYTNVATGKSIVLNGSGPATFTDVGGDWTLLSFQGRSVGVSEVVDEGAVYWSAGPGLVLYNSDPDEPVTVLQTPPVFRNVCDQLTQP
jgi:hypothetical protein